MRLHLRWQAAAAPKGLPPEVRTALHSALVASLNDQGNRQKMTEVGFDVVASTPEQFAKFLALELVRWKTVVTKGNISLD